MVNSVSMKRFLIPDSFFLHPNTDSCGSGLKRFKAFEIHGNCREIHGNCSLLWSSCWAGAVLPLPGTTAVAAATTQGPGGTSVITSALWPRDCNTIGGSKAPAALLGRTITSRWRACCISTQQRAGGGERKKENASHCCSRIVNSTAKSLL